MKLREGVAHRLAFVAVALAFTFWVWRLFDSLDDDAMIPMRYALNILRGHGWVMNPGERVEGTTSPFHVLIATGLSSFLGPDAAIWVQKLLGYGAGLWALACTVRIGKLAYGGTAVGLTGALLLAIRPEFALSMTNGLETCWATLFLAIGLERWLREQEGGAPWSALAFAGAALARPELTLVFPFLLALRHRRTDLLWGVLLFAVPVGSFLFFRWTYFGSLVPNTYYAKRMPLEEAWVPGLLYLAKYGSWLGAAIGLLALGAAPFGVRMARERAALAAILTLGVLFVIASGGTWMPDGRFLAPFMPTLFLAWGTLCVAAYRRFRSPELVVGAALALAVFDTADRSDRLTNLPWMGSLADRGSPSPLGRWRCCQPDGRRKMGDWIAAHVRPGRLVACSELGLPALMNMGVRFLDLRGLTDRTVARMSTSRHDQAGVRGDGWADSDGEMTRYVLASRPDAVIAFDAGSGTDRGFAAAYRLTERFDVIGDEGYGWPVTVWVRRER